MDKERPVDAMNNDLIGIGRESVKSVMFRDGKLYWEMSYGNRLISSYEDCLDAIKNGMHEKGFCLNQLRRLVGQMMAYMSATWVHYGMPIVQLAGHRYTAAMASTQPPKSCDIKAPWPVFLIELPIGMFSTLYMGKALAFSHMAVMRDATDATWNMLAFTSCNTMVLRRTKMTTADMCEDNDFTENHDDPYYLPMSDADDRTICILSRILLNTCLAMSDPDNVRPIGKHRRGSPGTPRHIVNPQGLTFRVGKPIVLDVRPALREYLDGTRKGSAPKVRFVVRGHWRNQACGPKLTERKHIWVLPYWKGPDEASINVRPHVLGHKEAHCESD